MQNNAVAFAAPPGEEDEEEGVRANGYFKGQRFRERERDNYQQYNGRENHQEGAEHHGQRYRYQGSQQQHKEWNGFPNNGPPWLKTRHGSAGSTASANGASSNGGGTASSTTSGYGSRGSRRSHGDGDSSGSPNSNSQRSIAFDDGEYTRITTPRTDMLFKKGYLGQRKHWSSGASMSATPSTTESHSASHSTAGRALGSNASWLIFPQARPTGQTPTRTVRPTGCLFGSLRLLHH